MHNFIPLIITIRKLRLKNIFYIFIYKLFLKTNIYRIFSKIRPCPIPENLSSKLIEKESKENYFNNTQLKNYANKIIKGEFKFFYHKYFKLGLIPNWFVDPYTSKVLSNAGEVHWSKSYINEKIDIKNIWELSRWYWAPVLAEAWKHSHNINYINKLEKLSKNWCINNPVNTFPNWTCGQEVSIRVLNVLQAWQILDYPKQIPALIPSRKEFVREHLKRIELTTIYAKAQCNNHWISEASALYIGGLWLKDKKLEKLGRNSLELSIKNLVLDDGTFSQYSLTYHRLVIDTINQVELWRRRFNSDKFSKKFRNKIIKLINWLNSFVDVKSGDGPNLGGNDGAYCYQLSSWEYRNFKPSINLGAELFNIEFKKELKKNKNFYCYGEEMIEYFPVGGFIKIKSNKQNTWGVLRLPKYIFRPSNIDPLHFDFWSDGMNLLRDGGSYKYNLPIKEMDYFQGIRSHNTIQFSDKEPMPRLTRFLFGNWLKPDKPPIIFINKDKFEVSSSYTCKLGQHSRKISKNIDSNLWVIEDNISNFKSKATLRWNLLNLDWELTQNTLHSKFANIEITSNVVIKSISLKKQYNSLFYNQKSISPVLEVEITQEPAKITTSIEILN